MAAPGSSVTDPESPLLLERGSELASIDAQIRRAAAGSGTVLVLEGPAGIGKTTLLRWVADRAAASGFEVHRARGSELERAFPFGGARQLLERRLHNAEAPERAALLAGAAGDAPQALGMAGDHEADAGRRALHSLYWLATNLAARRPLALCVDDLHWLDPSSLRWLAYTAARLDGVPLLLALSTRPAEPGADQELIDTFVLDDAAKVIRPASLSAIAIGELVTARLGDGVAAEFGAVCHRVSSGNPLLVVELLRDIARRVGEGPITAGSATVDVGAPTVARIVARRLRGLTDPAATVADVVAAIGRDADIAQVARIAGLTLSAARGAVVDLAATDILTVAGDALAFTHPLIATAVGQAMSTVRWADLHARIARDLISSGGEPERAAAHLLHTDPAGEAHVVAVLLAAGRDAAARGAPEAATGFLQRALSEPPAAGEQRAGVLLELGQAVASVPDPAYEAHLREAWAEAKAGALPHLAAECAVALGNALATAAHVEAAVAVFAQGLDEAPDDDRLQVALEAGLLGAGLSDVRLRPLVAERMQSRLTQLDAGEMLPPAVTAVLGGFLIDRPPARRAADVARTALVDHTFGDDRMTTAHILMALSADGAYEQALQVLADAIARERRRGTWGVAHWAGIIGADLHYRAGEVLAAEAAGRIATDALTRYEDTLDARGQPWVVAGLLPPLVARGLLDEADHLVRLVPGLLGRTHASERLLTGRAALRQAQGRTGEAIADLRAAGALFDPGEFPNPWQTSWRGRLANLLSATGEREEATALARGELGDAERFGSAVTIGIALAALGVAEGGADGAERLREAADVLAGTEARLEHARALIHLGAVLRRGGSPAAARDPLRAGLDLATRCGATAVADIAHAELITAGGRPRRDRRMLSGPESLTAGEHRVAALAAGGLTDREIAERLYVTTAAVRWHLRNTFRKLDVAGRGELAGALAGGVKP